MKKLLTSLLLLTAMVAYAEQEPVEYVTCSWNSTDKTVVHTSNTCSQYTQLSGGSSQTLESGWYVVRGRGLFAGVSLLAVASGCGGCCCCGCMALITAIITLH